MDILEELREDLASESIAYGYTLSVWGSGAGLITGLSSLEPVYVLGFVAGAVLGFGIFTMLLFRDPFENVDPGGPKMVAASMVHIFSSLGTVMVSIALVMLLAGSVNPVLLATIVGLNSTITYNLGLLAEEVFSLWVFQVLRHD